MCAHASTRQKGVLMMKRFRAAKKDRQRKENQLTDEERAERNERRSVEPPLSAQVEHLIYDYEHAQLGTHLGVKLKELCLLREKEIEDSRTQDINRLQLTRIQSILKKLEAEQNGNRRI